MLVLFSHSNGHGVDVNVGVMSVVIFYFISGCLMQRSFKRFVANSKTPIVDFYKDRLLKLFPQYALVVAATFLCIEFMGPSQHVLFMNQSFDWERFLLNITLLPANYVFEPLVIEGLLPHPVIPPSWSLSSESHFYLMLPFIAGLSRLGFACLFACVLCVQIFSLFFVGVYFNGDNFGYRFVMGSLVFFLLGYCYAAREDGFHKKLLYGVWLLYACILIFVAPMTDLLSHRFVLELLLGVMLSWPLVYLGMRFKVGWSTISAVDNYLGKLSYPVFISHFLAFYLCEKIFGLICANQVLYYPSVFFACILMSVLLAKVQVLFDYVRFKERGFASAVG